MQSPIKSKAITWRVVDNICITFYEVDDQSFSHGISIVPNGTKFHTQSLPGWEPFNSDTAWGSGIFTAGFPLVVSIMDKDGGIWACSAEGVRQEDQSPRLCKYFIDNEVLFEFDGTSTYLLLRDKKEPLTHNAIDWCDMIGSGSLEIIHVSGSRKLARMVKETKLPVSAEYMKKLVEVCK